MTASANSVSTLQNITPGIDNKNISGSSAGGDVPSSVNADGSIIAYATSASNMVPNDTNKASDVFLYHVRTKQTEIIRLADPTRVNVSADISPNGRYVAIVSYEQVRSGNTITFVSDLFVHDRTTKQNKRANIDATGKRMDVQHEVSVSDNGRVAFSSRVALGPLGIAQEDVMVTDIVTGTMRRVSAAAIPGQYFHSREPRISANGRHVAFVTNAQLMSRDKDIYSDVYQRNPDTGQLTFVSETMKNVAVPQEGSSYQPSVSADGKYTAFSSTGAVVRGNIKTPHEFFDQQDVFIHHRDFGITRIVSQAIPLKKDSERSVLYGNLSSAISSDGKSIAFVTNAQEIYPGHSTVLNLHLYYNPVVHTPYYDPVDTIDLF